VDLLFFALPITLPTTSHHIRWNTHQIKSLAKNLCLADLDTSSFYTAIRFHLYMAIQPRISVSNSFAWIQMELGGDT